MLTYKNITLEQVEAIVATHTSVSMPCPVSRMTTTLLQNARLNYTLQQNEDTMQHVASPCSHTEATIHTPCVITCMCCHHWIKRRQNLAVVPMPMQTLRWFLLTLQSCEHKRCDIRVIMRMARTITNNENNIYRSLFEETELCFLNNLTRSFQMTAKHRSAQIKCCIARFWHAQNGHSLFLPSAAVAEFLRVPREEMSYI